MQVFLKRQGALLEVSRDGNEPLRTDEYDRIVPKLKYQRRIFKAGREAWDGNSHRPIEVEERRRFTFDSTGRLVCAKGNLDWIVETYAQVGYRVLFQNLDPKRTESYAERPENLDVVEFRARQRDAIDAVAARIRLRRGCIVKAACGFGKSFLLRAWCELFYRARIAIVVPDKDNLNKTLTYLREHLASVGQIGDGKIQRGCRLTVATMGSLHHVDPCDILFADEAHRFAADRAAAEVGRLADRAVCVGLTATPVGRMDGADSLLTDLFGPVVFDLPYTEALARGLVVPVEVVWHDVRMDKNPCGWCKTTTARKRHGLWLNKVRNQVIADVASSYPDDTQVLVMAQSVEHVLHLQALLPGFEVVYALDDTDRITSLSNMSALRDLDIRPMTRDRRRAMKDAFEHGELKKVIATDVWSVGVSFDALSVLVRADARSNPIIDEQLPSRADRIHGASGKTRATIHDFLDQFDGGFASQSNARRRNYKDIGWAEILPSRARRSPRGIPTHDDSQCGHNGGADPSP